jgi:ring-1,2-phenylacetyl-CoA epoxidase subunit PaaC
MDEIIHRYLLRHGDRAMVLCQRLTEWVTHAPELEEELALANIALDLLGQARTLYAYAAEREGAGATEDDLAYWRGDREYLNVLLVEQPNGNFAATMARQLLHDAYAIELWSALASSTDERLAGLAARAVKETAYHLRHAHTWVVRLGDGTDESHALIQRAVDELWRFTGELFEGDAVEADLAARGVAPSPSALQPAWRGRVEGALAEATLTLPEDGVMASGGRHGIHGEQLSYLLGEMQVLARRFPGATW